MIRNFIKRYRFFKSVYLANDSSCLNIEKKVDLHTSKSSIIEVNGKVNLGYPLPTLLNRPSYTHSLLKIGNNSKVIFGDNVFIANGFSIIVGDNSVLEFAGNNFIAHNLTILCNKKIFIGNNSSISWNCTLIDDDNHQFYQPNGTVKIKKTNELNISNDVAIQMNVSIPKGVTLNTGCIIGAGTYVRSSVPENCLFYGKQEIEIRTETTFGF